MSHKARRITKIVLILSVIVGSLAFCHFVYTAYMRTTCYDLIQDQSIGTPDCQEVWSGGEEILRVDAAIVMVAAVFLIGAIFISLRIRRNHLGVDLSMSHKARRITKIVLILPLVIGGFAFCDLAYNAYMETDCNQAANEGCCTYSETGSDASYVACTEIPQREERLRWDAAIVMVAAVFLIGAIVIYRRTGRHRR